jgi:copper homeostasis protein CutC
MADSLNDLREIDAAWSRHFNEMLTSGAAQPAEAVESMLRIAELIAESINGPRDTAARLVAAALFFTQRIPVKRTKDVDEVKNSAVFH